MDCIKDMSDLYHECEEAFTTTGSEERELFGVGSILVAIIPSCQDMTTIALYREINIVE